METEKELRPRNEKHVDAEDFKTHTWKGRERDLITLCRCSTQKKKPAQSSCAGGFLGASGYSRVHCASGRLPEIFSVLI